MTGAVHHATETTSNADRDLAARLEPKSLRTFTPSQAVLAKSAGVYHWTPEGRKLFDFSSGVLVANLGHNPSAWMQNFIGYMGWTGSPWEEPGRSRDSARQAGYFNALALTAYNAITSIEPAGRQAASASPVGSVRFGSDSKSSLGGSGTRPQP
jgi:hypothetical protein